MNLDIGEVAANRSFVFLWCGSSEGLDMGRFCLRKWGFRRCEDICWIRTNVKNPSHSKNIEAKAVFQRTKVSFHLIIHLNVVGQNIKLFQVHLKTEGKFLYQNRLIRFLSSAA